MQHTGYFKIHRSIFKHWSKPFDQDKAWVWLLGEAGYENGCTGKLYTSRRYLAEAWGVHNRTVARWLDDWKNKKQISVQVLLKAAPTSAPTSAPRHAPSWTEITIMNYQKYQTKTTEPAPTSAPSGAPTSAPKRKELINKELNTKNPPTPQRGQATRKARASHDPEVLNQKLMEINQAELFREFEPQGLDVQTWFDNFCEFVMKGNAKDPRPNPASWVDFKRAAKDSARLAISKGWFPIRGQPGSTNPASPQKGGSWRDKVHRKED